MQKWVEYLLYAVAGVGVIVIVILSVAIFRLKVRKKPPQPILSDVKGLGGWLVWFQLRLWLSLAGTPTLRGGQAVLLSILVLVCMFFFYRKNIRFRIVYIILSFVNFAMQAFIYYIYGVSFIGVAIAYCLVEGLMIYALFHSRRVQNTFK